VKAFLQFGIFDNSFPFTFVAIYEKLHFSFKLGGNSKAVVDDYVSR
jgi:hypothetical protein